MNVFPRAFISDFSLSGISPEPVALNNVLAEPGPSLYFNVTFWPRSLCPGYTTLSPYQCKSLLRHLRKEIQEVVMSAYISLVEDLVQGWDASNTKQLHGSHTHAPGNA